MKLASVALSALAIALATPALAEDAAPQEQGEAAYPHTAQGAADFVAAVEKDLAEFSIGNVTAMTRGAKEPATKSARPAHWRRAAR